ncbi:MAG: hypothetical protein JW741_30315 [Sedimentisphaerales bacterium]|nr:hypothetical protein [Sedimentisphaerales bacterium]
MRKCVGMVLMVATGTLLGSLARAQEATLEDQARATLRKACAYMHSISTNGGYVGIYSEDLTERYGEALYEKAAPTEIWVQPPGTPSVGQAYLRAYRVTGRPWYLSAAKDAARALAWGQRTTGGWDHRVDVAHLDPNAARVVRHGQRCTFDDDITQGALHFLVSLDEEIDEPWLTEAVELGFAFMMKSQFPNGAWPQWYPLRGGYHDHYTFNDRAMNDCIELMLRGHRVYGRQAYLDSAKRGGDFIILAQLAPPQAGWAQQYTHDLKPAWARRFEPPGVCSLVTVSNIQTLIDLYLYTQDKKYLEPIPKAIAWLESSKIGSGRWARLYEVGTNRPIYGDREDGNKIHYDYEKISEREKSSYGWQGGFGIPAVVARYRRAVASETTSARSNRAARSTGRTGPMRPALESRVRQVIDALDEEGRWLQEGRIRSETFVRNVNLLCDCLQSASPR